MMTNVKALNGKEPVASISNSVINLIESPELHYPDLNALSYLLDIFPYRQIRLYCHVESTEQRTSHFRTTNSALGYEVIKFAAQLTGINPFSLSSYRLYSDDSSKEIRWYTNWYKWRTVNYGYEEFSKIVASNDGELWWSIENKKCEIQPSFYQSITWQIYVR